MTLLRDTLRKLRGCLHRWLALGVVPEEDTRFAKHAIEVLKRI